MRLYINALGTRVTQVRFERLGNAAINAKPAMEASADIMMEVIANNFKSQGRRGGGSWRKDTAAWLARKLRKGLDPRIGHATHALRDSMTKRESENQDLQISDNRVRLGTRLEYAEAFNRQRPFTRFTEADRERITRVVKQHLMDAWGNRV